MHLWELPWAQACTTESCLLQTYKKKEKKVPTHCGTTQKVLGRRKAVGANGPVPAKLEVVGQRPNRSGAGQATGRQA